MTPEQAQLWEQLRAAKLATIVSSYVDKHELDIGAGSFTDTALNRQSMDVLRHLAEILRIYAQGMGCEER